MCFVCRDQNATLMIDGQCVCNTGYYETLNYSCQLCNPTCYNCSLD